MGLCPPHRAVGSKCTRHIVTAFSLHALCSSLEMTEEIIPCLVRILTTFKVSLKQFVFSSEGTQVAVQFTHFPLGPVEGKEGPITIFGAGTGTRFWSGMWFVTSVIPTLSYVVHHWNSTGAQDLSYHTTGSSEPTQLSQQSSDGEASHPFQWNICWAEANTELNKCCDFAGRRLGNFQALGLCCGRINPRNKWDNRLPWW